MTRVAITHTAALSAFGAGTRGIARALSTAIPLAGLPPEEPLAAPRARKMMSRAAYLAARCLAELLRGVGGESVVARESIAYYLGVGGSAGSLDDVTALLDVSIVDGAFSLARFGDRGLAACNPLLAFQLMNNFTLCHGAILEGLGGPNGALFSRGAGTVAAIAEALHAIRSGEAALAITGGADVATHPVAIAELAREGFLARGLVPGDGVALLALAASTSEDDVAIEGVAHASGRDRSVALAIEDALARAYRSAAREGGVVDIVILAPWGRPAADALRSLASTRFPDATTIDTSALGETLAASAALAVLVAVDALRDRRGRAIVLSLGVDGDPGVVLLSRGAA